jgi:radical SAM-linked protein
MKADRLVALRKLDAHATPATGKAEPRRLPLVAGPRVRGRMEAPAGFAQAEGRRWRIRYAKVGRGAFISHLDTMRLLVRLFRRARVELIYSKGFHPKPQLTFAPALGLGVAALGDLFDVRIDYDGDATVLAARLNAAAPEGFVIAGARALGLDEAAVSRRLARADFAAWLPTAPATLRDLADGATVARAHKHGSRPATIDVAQHVEGARIVDGAEAAELRRALGWPDGGGAIAWRTKIDHDGGARPVEIVEALVGAAPADCVRFARTALWSLVDGALVDPMTEARPAVAAPADGGAAAELGG